MKPNKRIRCVSVQPLITQRMLFLIAEIGGYQAKNSEFAKKNGPIPE
jgi:hypothetical protein